MKLSLHRALAELKMLNKRILSSINDKQYVTYQIGEEKPKGYQSTKEFEELAAAGYQSVTDLIKRRNEIKSKLILANATTKVNIAGVEMTIAEAIDQQEFIEYKQSLLNELKRQLAVVNQKMEIEKQQMENRLDKRLEADLGSKDRKNHAAEVEEITENFLKRYNPKVVDPIEIRKEIEKLETEINAFLIEVDSVKSEANATTFIEISA
ncbi:hypothetical protein PDK03_07485 [Bacillus cereus group sp. TH204-1LC]|uniref:hypothetical protein n=1 Tax=Bacillus cereus group TaxID=86661 RepID=UPI000A2023A5|nr:MULTISPECIES: hypothetical protein [unclassified Bacillus cereus group]ARO21420.1 hypothetical protein B2J90_28905 [Bacillus cereus]MDA1616440.1 hypothetical protein [Bacillus cereus group sp. TH204-1LC]MDA1918166.1 hypothetical protein [Bacillus cereus group sp. BcHK140]MDA1977104.1 hypothetical protein [Bacillus cereus]